MKPTKKQTQILMNLCRIVSRQKLPFYNMATHQIRTGQQVANEAMEAFGLPYRLVDVPKKKPARPRKAATEGGRR